MDKNEWLELINLKDELIPQGRHNRPGTALAATWVTSHNTSNTDSTPSATRAAAATPSLLPPVGPSD